MDRIPTARVYASPQTGSHYLAIPVYVRPIGNDEYRVRVDLSGLPVGQRAAIAAALEVKGFSTGTTAQDLSHVSRVFEGRENVVRGAGHAAAQYLRAVIATYGNAWFDWLDPLAEVQEESPAAETVEESPADLDEDF